MSTVAFVAAVIAAVTVGPTLLVLLAVGSYRLGKLVNKAENWDANSEALISTVSAMRNELRQIRKMRVKQAGSPHGTGGVRFG